MSLYRAFLLVKLCYSKSHYTNNKKSVLQNGFWRHCVSDRNGQDFMRISCAERMLFDSPVNLFALVLSQLLQK